MVKKTVKTKRNNKADQNKDSLKNKDGFSLKEQYLKNKEFMVYLSLFLLLSVLVILNSVDDLNVTGNAIIQISYMSGGEELHFEVKDVTGVKEVTIPLRNAIKNGKVLLYNNQEIEFAGTYYSKFTILSEEEDKFGEINLLLKIKEDELLAKGIAGSDLSLFVDNDKLETSLTEKKDGYLFYTATSGKFGDFVIGKNAVEKEAIAEVENVSEIDLEVNPVEVPAETPKLPLAGEAIETEAIETGNVTEVKVGFWARFTAFLKEIFN